MALSHRLTLGMSNGNVNIADVITTTPDYEINIDRSIAAGVTNGALVDFVFVKAKLQDITIRVDGPLTLKTNSSSSPQETLTLLAGTPYQWNIISGYFANPFAADVTTGFVTNAGAVAVRLQVTIGAVA